MTINKAQELCAALDKDILCVGVFVYEKPDIIKRIALNCELDVLQIYQDHNEDVSYTETIWRAIRIKNESSLSVIKNIKADAYLLDAYSDTAYGGTGETFNWELAKKRREIRKLYWQADLHRIMWSRPCEQRRRMRLIPAAE